MTIADSTHANRRANRLGASTSPYLLQHAFNPVDWYPWGEEAFAEARRRDVPIFLSIGYSTCYWCHVMERESFENDAIAALMNERFVCIKVDREERPDVDDIYMTATQVLTGHGGWPMNCFLEPALLRPFWCGTYFPPTPRPGMGVPAFPQVLSNIGDAYRLQRAEVVAQSEQIAAIVRERMKPPARPEAIDGAGIITEAISGLLRMFDRNHGGFGGAPKFPQPAFLELLLDARASAASPATRDAIDQALRTTLDRMMIGGLFDQIGGGFHRYSVDAHWTVPHFEKMLYDNALLARVYARASGVYADEEYARVARETCRCVLRDFRTAGGAFASAQDAEVDGREGLNYLWTADEVRAVLGADEASFALGVFGLDKGPNFQDPHHPGEPARSVLRLSDRPERVAASLGLSTSEFHARRAAAAGKLLRHRLQREQPHLDDKVLTAWNGLMIGALAVAGQMLGEGAFVTAARGAADFVLKSLRTADGRLARSWRAGVVGGPGYLEDTAFLVSGLHELGDALGAEGGRPYKEAAEDLSNRAHHLFADKDGVYFDTEASDAALFVRARSSHDGAVPCGATVQLHNLLEQNRPDRALGLLSGIAETMREVPLGLSNGVRAALRAMSDPEHQGGALAAFLRGKAPETPGADANFTPVEIYASEERLTVGPDSPASMTLVLQIAPEYHVIAADPWVDDPASAHRGLLPLRVHVVGGSGVRVYADYPAGAPYESGAGAFGKPRVYNDRIEFEVAVEAEGEWKGRPMLAVTFQACSGTECLVPRTAELDISIDRG